MENLQIAYCANYLNILVYCCQQSAFLWLYCPNMQWRF